MYRYTMVYHIPGGRVEKQVGEYLMTLFLLYEGNRLYFQPSLAPPVFAELIVSQAFWLQSSLVCVRNIPV